MLLLVMGIIAGLYDIPLQAFLQDRSPRQSRGSIMAAYNFLTFTGHVGWPRASIWLLVGSVGPFARARIFLVGGIATAVRSRSPSSGCCRSRRRGWSCGCWCGACIACAWKGRRTCRRAAACCWWPTTSVGPTACCWAWPARATRAWSPIAKYFENRWLGWFGRLGRIIPIGTTRKSMVDSIRAAARGFAARRVGLYLCGRRDHAHRRNRGISPRFPVDTEGYRRPGRAGLPGRALGEHLQLRRRKVLLEMAAPLALSRHHPFWTADPRTGRRRSGPAGSRAIGRRSAAMTQRSCIIHHGDTEATERRMTPQRTRRMQRRETNDRTCELRFGE